MHAGASAGGLLFCLLWQGQATVVLIIVCHNGKCIHKLMVINFMNSMICAFMFLVLFFGNFRNNVLLLRTYKFMCVNCKLCLTLLHCMSHIESIF